jgi:outer membrane PBP1 activator LpoA protein
MKARQRITTLLKEWLEMTHREFHAIQMGRWSELSRIQKAKADLQLPLTDAIEQWKIEYPAESTSHPFRDEISRLLDLESHNSELLALRKREVREKILLLEQALYDLHLLHSSYAQTEAA